METTLKTKFGFFKIEEPSWGGFIYLSTEQGDSIRLFSPDADDPDEYEIEVRIDSSYLTDEDEIEDVANLLLFSRQIVQLLKRATKGDREAAEKRRKEQEAAEEKEREEHEALIKSREDRLMMEFVGETVKIRESGYKTARQAIIEVEEYGDEFSVRFAYTGQDWRTQQLSRIKRLDIKVGSRWKTLWDDGTSDIGGAWALASSAKPTGELYDAMRADD